MRCNITPFLTRCIQESKEQATFLENRKQILNCFINKEHHIHKTDILCKKLDEVSFQRERPALHKMFRLNPERGGGVGVGGYFLVKG